MKSSRTPIKVLDLQEYHLPSLDTLDFILKKHGMIYSESSRGCGWAKCTFCNRQFARGTTLRAIPEDVVVGNLERLYKRGVKIVYFTDEDFLLYNPDRIIAISKALIEKNIKLSFWIQTRADNLYSPSATPQENEKKLEAIRLFHKAGLQRILFGVESGSPTQARRYNKGIDLQSIARRDEDCQGRRSASRNRLHSHRSLRDAHGTAGIAGVHGAKRASGFHRSGSEHRLPLRGGDFLSRKLRRTT